MATLRDIRRKIAAVRKTQQITRAMNMVASAKLRGAQERMIAFRPYAEKYAEVMRSVAQRVEADAHPLLVRREVKKVGVLLVTSDRGLCGSFNTNLIARAEKEMKARVAQGQHVCFFAVGRKGRDYFRRRKAEVRGGYVDNRKITYDLAARVAEDLITSYVQEELDEVFLVYSRFINLAVQRPALEGLLPFVPAEAAKEGGSASSAVDYLYEPEPHILLEAILPEQIRVQVYHALLETNTSEQAARMTAMDNATRNCKEMIDRLTLVYNKARQASITKELMDIVGGAEALKK
ncbi:MAG: ATP synthase F1 subunit gamma [Thermodesulfobacteriota bacterium]